MENSKIEWCDHTFNPWSGCAKVSPGCTNCYAEVLANRFDTFGKWGKGKPRKRASGKQWAEPLKWNESLGLIDCMYDYNGDGDCHIHPNGCPRRHPRVFCASMADWLDDEVPIDWLADLLDLIRKTPNLDWLLLTKRPENWTERLHSAIAIEGYDPFCFAAEWLDGDVPENIWLGTSVENQEMADKRIPELLKIPARVRFLSCEPLLGPITFNDAGRSILKGVCTMCVPYNCELHGSPELLATATCNQEIHWVIAGGESGPKARPMHPNWARSLRDQCQAAGVPFLFKQWGEWIPEYAIKTEKQFKPNEVKYYYSDGTIKEIGQGHMPGNLLYRVGKKAAGRTLDGETWDEFPETTHNDNRA